MILDMNKITFVPIGGLANRMRTIASALMLSQQTNSRLNIVWFKDWALYAPFGMLFEPIVKERLSLREAEGYDALLFDRPRKKNLYLPAVYQSMAFADCIYERSFYSLTQQNFNFVKWVNEKKNVYMASYTAFQPYENTLMSELFVPVPMVRDKIEKRCSSFSENMIGVHIRRTDNIASIEKSPLELFYRELDLELDKNERNLIYLATDSEEVKSMMKKRYGNKILSSTAPADRSSIDGIQDGIADMYTLARTNKIYGSFQSSFSEIASQIGGNQLVILKV